MGSYQMFPARNLCNHRSPYIIALRAQWVVERPIKPRPAVVSLTPFCTSHNGTPPLASLRRLRLPGCLPPSLPPLPIPASRAVPRAPARCPLRRVTRGQLHPIPAPTGCQRMSSDHRFISAWPACGHHASASLRWSARSRRVRVSVTLGAAWDGHGKRWLMALMKVG